MCDILASSITKAGKEPTMIQLKVLRSKVRALAPALLLIVFLGTVKIVVTLLRLQTRQTNLGDAPAIAEFGARLGWGVAIVVLALAVIWTTLVAVVVIYRCLSFAHAMAAILFASAIGLFLSI